MAREGVRRTERVHHGTTDSILRKGRELDVAILVEAVKRLEQTDRSEGCQGLAAELAPGRQAARGWCREQQDLALILAADLLAGQSSIRRSLSPFRCVGYMIQFPSPSLFGQVLFPIRTGSS